MAKSRQDVVGVNCVKDANRISGISSRISSAPSTKKRMHIPRLKEWKMRETNVKQEFARLVTDRKDEVFEAENVESKWNANAMKEVWQKATWVDKRTTEA